MNRFKFLAFLGLVLVSLGGCESVKKHEQMGTREDQERLDALMAQKRGEVTQCYAAAKGRNPKAVGEGELIIKMDRRPDGGFSNPRLLEGFKGSDPVFECIAQNIGSWKVERYFNRGPVELTWDLRKAD